MFRWILGILLILLGVLGTIGLIKEAIKTKVDKKEFQKNVSGIVAGIIFIIIGWLVIPSSTATPVNSLKNESLTPSQPASSSAKDTQKPNSQQTSQVEEKPVYSIGMTPDKFKESFNQQAQAFGSDFRINSLDITEGPVQNSFKCMFTDHLGLVGTINKKDGSIRDVMLIGQGDGTLKSGANILTGMGVLIAVTNPSLAPEERGQILKDLGITEGADINNLDNKTVRNGMKYSLSSSKEIGIMFSVGNENDPGN